MEKWLVLVQRMADNEATIRELETSHKTMETQHETLQREYNIIDDELKKSNDVSSLCFEHNYLHAIQLFLLLSKFFPSYF